MTLEEAIAKVNSNNEEMLRKMILEWLAQMSDNGAMAAMIARDLDGATEH
jgi:hypothetical protein